MTDPAATPEPSDASDGPVVQPPGAQAPGTPDGPRIEPWLREILRCPACHGDLVDGQGPQGPELQCHSCQRGYGFFDDAIPVLLIDEARPLAG